MGVFCGHFAGVWGSDSGEIRVIGKIPISAAPKVALLDLYMVAPITEALGTSQLSAKPSSSGSPCRLNTYDAPTDLGYPTTSLKMEALATTNPESGGFPPQMTPSQHYDIRECLTVYS